MLDLEPAALNREDVGERMTIDVEPRVVLLGLEDEEGRVRARHAVTDREIDDRLLRLGL